MKTSLLKVSVITIIFSMITFISCDTNDEGIENSEPVSTVDIAANDELDIAVEEVNNIVEQAFVEEENGLTATKQNGGNSFFPDCLTKTVVTTNLSKIVTLDFGDGCIVRGHFIAGILTMSYEKDTTLHTRTISVEFDNFRVNHKLIVGNYSIVRMRNNENNNPQSTATIDIGVTWDNGDFASREGVKIREWIEGHGTGIWSDNVYLITGNWTSVLKNGNVISAQITTPLRRELVCRFFISGEVALQKNNRTATLNFGDGNCDNEAILTLQNGTEIIIYLS